MSQCCSAMRCSIFSQTARQPCGVSNDLHVSLKVFKAELLVDPPETVACKVLHPSVGEIVARKEAQMLASIRSEYVVSFSCASICPGSCMLHCMSLHSS